VRELVVGLGRLEGSTQVRADLLGRAAEELAHLRDDVADDPARQLELAQSAVLLAEALGAPDQPSLGRHEEARAGLADALALAADAARGRPAGAAALRARALLMLSKLARFEARNDEAALHLVEAREVLEPWLVADPSSPLEQRIRAEHTAVLVGTASLAGSAGRHADALEAFERLRERHAAELARAPDDPELQLALAQAELNVGLPLFMLERFDEAAEAMAAGLGVFAERIESGVAEPALEQRFVTSHVPYTRALIRSGETERALAVVGEALRRADAAIANDPRNRRLVPIRVELVYNLGWAHQRRAEDRADAEDAASRGAVRRDLEHAADAFVLALERFRAARAAGALPPAWDHEERILGRLEAVEARLAAD